MATRKHFTLLTLLLATATFGCTTTRHTDTSRTGLEQLLVSNAVDQALDRYTFEHLRGRAVYLEEEYLECVDRNYVLGSIRQRVLAGGGRLVEDRDQAEVILEARSGGIGTDRKDLVIGIPSFAIPTPQPITLPELPIVTQSRQVGTAKIGLVAYDARSKGTLGGDRLALARSNVDKWYILGLTPFDSGSVHEEIRTAERAEQPVTAIAGDLQYRRELVSRPEVANSPR